MMDYVFRKNDIAWLKMWMLLLFLMTSIYVKTHEGGRNGDQKDGRESLRASTNTS
jgi:hypothetical protein